MGESVSEPLGEFWDRENRRPTEKFEGNGKALSITTAVAPDGGDMNLQLQRGDQVGMTWSLSFGEACQVYHELRVATDVAQGRQRMTKELSMDAIADLIRTALTPDSIGFTIDRQTGEFIIAYLFKGHAPFAVRLTAEMACKARKDFETACAKQAN